MRPIRASQVGFENAREDAVDCHAATLKTARQFEGEMQVAELGLAIGLHHAVGPPLPVQVREVHDGVDAGANVDDPRGRAGLQSLQEQMRQEKGGEVVDRQSAFDAVGAQPPRGKGGSGIVDQKMYPVEAFQNLLCQCAQCRLIGQIGNEQMQIRVVGAGLYLGNRRFAARTVTRDQSNAPSGAGQCVRDRLAQARIGAGDERGLPVGR